MTNSTSKKEGHVSIQEVTNTCNFFTSLKVKNSVIMFLFQKAMRILKQFLSFVSYIDNSVAPDPQVGTGQYV